MIPMYGVQPLPVDDEQAFDVTRTNERGERVLIRYADQDAALNVATTLNHNAGGEWGVPSVPETPEEAPEALPDDHTRTLALEITAEEFRELMRSVAYRQAEGGPAVLARVMRKVGDAWTAAEE
ncbi:hypothetical protein [Streptomyces sp. SID14515]|uniref:hypothetical protein n=1 Tax=Streptomyces sp. SID14515 TaxID=2706074 RepID=UPI0013C770F6|nr:hypothetical protein [Streptomyces sp. SID14515]NEB35887.1 hypothetical protein [Streptomyces sp. SID14515]